MIRLRRIEAKLTYSFELYWRNLRMIKFRFIVMFIPLVLFGCGEAPAPLDEIRETLKGVPTYSIVLDDMREEGNFLKKYYHKYRVLMEEKVTDTGWREVSQEYFRRYEPFLGMTIWSKKDGKDNDSVGPPGYEYVGDPRYGEWKTDTSGRSFWEFYGQYRLISDLLGGGLIYRDNYNNYRTYGSRGQPYYGPRKEYGTGGSVTRRQKPNFYTRRMQREQAKRTSFSDKVNRRIGRTRVPVRGRSVGWGK
jgi:hypothetical protein